MTSPDSEGTLDKMGVIENRIRLANLYCLYNSRHFYAPHHTSYMLERAHGDFLPTLTGCSQIQRLRPRRYSSMTFPAGSHPQRDLPMRGDDVSDWGTLVFET